MSGDLNRLRERIMLLADRLGQLREIVERMKAEGQSTAELDEVIAAMTDLFRDRLEQRRLMEQAAQLEEVSATRE